MAGTDKLLSRIQPWLFAAAAQRLWLWGLALLTLLLLAQALRIQPSAGLDKTLPLDHPHMQVFRQYQEAFGGANLLLVALQNQDGSSIYTERFLAALRTATDEVNFAPGVDRARLSSLFTRNVRYIEVVDGGFSAGDVIPANYAPSAEMFARIAESVGKAGLSGRLVSLQQDGALVYAEVLERDPTTGAPTDLVRTAKHLEQLRARFEQQQVTRYRLKTALAPVPAGTLVAEVFGPEPWYARYLPRQVAAPAEAVGGGQRAYPWQLQRQVAANPHYDANLRLHIIGFAKLVGDASVAMAEVAAFFVLTVLGTGLVLAWYVGSWRLALLPLACSLVAVVWEFGLLSSLGMGLDPFAILVPFLVLAVSTSHGVQYVNTWVAEALARSSSASASDETPALAASIATFRQLFVPGSIALITNVAGFATIYLVPIPAVREMAVHACLGMVAVIVTNKVLMPLLLARVRLPDAHALAARHARRAAAAEPLWKLLASVTRTGPALALLSLAAAVFAGSLYLQQQRIIGDAAAGVPELRPDSRYNRDVQAIAQSYALGTDVLKVIAETAPDSCVDYDTLTQIDDFSWRMRNVPGVVATVAMPQVARRIHAGFWENSPRMAVIPRNGDALVLSTKSIESSTGLLDFACTAMPVLVYAQDHRAQTIAKLTAAVERLQAENAADYYRRHPSADRAACAEVIELRRELGVVQVARQKQLDHLRTLGLSPDAAKAHASIRALDAQAAKLQPPLLRNCPVHFALATGNLGVMGATNEAVEHAELPALLWVYAVIFTLIGLCYRSLAGWLVIGLPLLMVSVFANALMAVFGIGLKVATLPVVTLAVGIGVDYGIYVYDVLQRELRSSAGNLQLAYLNTLRQTGKAVIFTGICLAGGVSAWLFSGLQFQRDMGLLLVFMFSANMLGAVLIGPALCRFVLRAPNKKA